MPNFLYCAPPDQQATAATWSASPGLASGYQAAWVADRRPERPSRLSAANGYWEADCGSATRVDLVAICGHSLSAGATVTVAAGATSPPATLSKVLTIPAARPDGLSRPVWASLIGATGYSQSGFRYWRFTVAGNSSSTCQISEIWLARVITQLPQGLHLGTERAEWRAVVEHRTERGVRLRYDRGVVTRSLRASATIKTDAALQAFVDWFRGAKGTLLPSLVVTDDTLDTDCALVVFDEARTSWVRKVLGVYEVSVAVTELPVAV